MEKAPIKKFAVEARRKLIADVTFQLERYGITEKGIVEPQTSTDKELVFDLGNGNTQTIKGERYVNQYRNLVAHVRGFYADGSPKQQLEQFIEEIAFTWFNRLIAIRFMEVNRYVPVRVLSSEIEGQKLPDLVKSPFSGDLEFTDAEKQHIFDLQDANKEDDLFRFVFFKQCNDLSRILPRLFENLEGHGSYSELLVVLSFSDPNGVVYRLVNEVDERWFDIHATDEEGKPMGQVQIIGWMYQYYNTEPKEQVFKDLKKNIKISKQNIPAATQLFTPDWIVRYMVENSLGRLWYEGHPGFDKSEWKYYLDEAPQEPQVEQQLQEIRAQYAKMEPEQLKVIDPCMGSGHILCYLFDVLMQIYLDNGYSKREAVRSILENNLFGLDIDKRAAQIAYFSVMMKAREYDSNFFSRSNIPQPRVYDIQESNWLGGAYKHEMGNFLNSQEHQDTLNYLLDAFVDAKEYGSILQIKPLDYEGLKEAWETSAAATAGDINMVMWYDAVNESVKQLIEQAIMLSQKYDVVATNPPYMGAKKMDGALTEYTKKHYVHSKGDLFAVFIDRCDMMLNPNGFQSMITQHAWMFLDSFKELRVAILNKTIINMAHLGTRAFEEIGGEVVQTVTFVLRKSSLPRYNGTYIRLVNELSQDEKEQAFLAKSNVYHVEQESFAYIDTKQIAYWLGKTALELFVKNKISDYADACYGFITGDNEKYLRLWYEVPKNEINLTATSNDSFLLSRVKYAPCNKGGAYRKWYGNNDYVALWKEQENFHRNGSTYQYAFFKEGLTWSVLSSNKFNSRYYGEGFVFDHAAASLFVTDQNATFYILGYLNSCVFDFLLKAMNPTINSGAEIVSQIPLAYEKNCHDEVAMCSKQSVDLSKTDWDSFETSWDFKKHPLV